MFTSAAQTLEMPRPAGRTLAIGFATTVAMWAVGYVSLMQPGLVIGEALFGITLACLLAGGFVAGRAVGHGERAWVTGAKVGFVSAALNLLIIGSLVGGASGDDKGMRMATWTAGAFAISIGLATVGAMIGGRFAAPTTDASRIAPRRSWFHVFTCVAALTVFLLLITGGLVTGLEAGLAVPDWPNSFGHNMLLYPLSEMVGGIYYEHAHRLYGMLVGVTAITLAVSMFKFDSRSWLRALGVSFLLMVCIQGIMGGTRVTETSIVLAIAHGVFGQIVFATIVAIAAFTSPTWMHLQQSQDSGAGDPLARTSSHSRDARAAVVGSADRTATLLLLILLVLQLTLGALYRHLNAQPELSERLVTGLLHGHILLAVLVVLAALLAGGRAWGIHRQQPVLPRLGSVLLLLVGFQILLGVDAMIAVLSREPSEPIPVLEVAITTAHQATGALLLATSALLFLWTRRLFPAVQPQASRQVSQHAASSPKAEPAAPTR